MLTLTVQVTYRMTELLALFIDPELLNETGTYHSTQIGSYLNESGQTDARLLLLS